MASFDKFYATFIIEIERFSKSKAVAEIFLRSIVVLPVGDIVVWFVSVTVSVVACNVADELDDNISVPFSYKASVTSPVLPVAVVEYLIR